MKIHIEGKPMFSFELSAEDLALLTQLSEHHYDWACKRLSSKADAPGRRNGLLTIAALGFSPSQASEYELQLLLKCMEMTEYLPDDERMRARRLRAEFYQAWCLGDAKRREWVTEIGLAPAQPAGA